MGLPVHRLDKEKKSRVFAYRSELEAWLKDRSGGPVRSPAHARRLFLRIVVPAAAGLMFLTALLVAALPMLRGGLRTPANFRIEGSELVILNKNSGELWRWNSGQENLLDEGRYRSRYQVRRTTNGWTDLPWLAIKDFDADGRPEVLFATQTSDEFGEGLLVCLDGSGHERWRFQAGRAMTFGDRTYSPDYRINGFETADLDGDGRPEILVPAFHNNDFPCQLAVLGLDGSLRAEFWNSGQISDLAVHDFDGDGRPELMLGGVNNEYRKPFLAIFEPDAIRGGSPQTDPAFQSRALLPGSEKRYLLLPRTDVARALSPLETVRAIHLLGNDKIEAVIDDILHGILYFEFDFRLTAGRVRGSHAFEKAHRETLAAGKISSRLDTAYYRALEKGILSWNGSAWIKLPPPTFP